MTFFGSHISHFQLEHRLLGSRQNVFIQIKLNISILGHLLFHPLFYLFGPEYPNWEILSNSCRLNFDFLGVYLYLRLKFWATLVQTIKFLHFQFVFFSVIKLKTKIKTRNQSIQFNKIFADYYDWNFSFCCFKRWKTWTTINTEWQNKFIIAFKCNSIWLEMIFFASIHEQNGQTVPFIEWILLCGVADLSLFQKLFSFSSSSSIKSQRIWVISKFKFTNYMMEMKERPKLLLLNVVNLQLMHSTAETEAQIIWNSIVEHIIWGHNVMKWMQIIRT